MPDGSANLHDFYWCPRMPTPTKLVTARYGNNGPEHVSFGPHGYSKKLRKADPRLDEAYRRAVLMNYIFKKGGNLTEPILRDLYLAACHGDFANGPLGDWLEELGDKEAAGMARDGYAYLAVRLFLETDDPAERYSIRDRFAKFTRLTRAMSAGRRN